MFQIITFWIELENAGSTEMMMMKYSVNYKWWIYYGHAFANIVKYVLYYRTKIFVYIFRLLFLNNWIFHKNLRRLNFDNILWNMISRCFVLIVIKHNVELFLLKVRNTQPLITTEALLFMRGIKYHMNQPIEEKLQKLQR